MPRDLIRFGIKLALFVAVVAAIDSIGLLFRTPVHPANVESDRKVGYYREMLASKENYDVIAVGSSLTQSGFDPAVFDRATGWRSFNAGLAGRSSVILARQIVEEVARKRPALIVYAIESWSLVQPPDAAAPATAEKRPQMLHFLNMFKNRDEMRKWGRTVLRDGWRAPPAMQPETTISARFASFSSVRALPNGLLEFHAIARPSFVPGVADSFELVPEQASALTAVIAFAKREGIALLLVQMPEYRGEIDRSATRQKAFRTYMAEFSRAHGVPYLDFNFDLPFARDDIQLYYDVNHLNMSGAERYTGTLAAEVLALCAAGKLECPRRGKPGA